MRIRQVVLCGVALLSASTARADEVRSPLSGTWKLSVFIQGQDIALAIVKIEIKDGKASGTVVATGARTFDGARLEQVKAGERSLHFTFKTTTSTFQVAAYGRVDGRRPRLLTGSLEIRGNVEVATLERTTEDELDKANPASPAEGADLLKKLNTKDDDERAAVAKSILEKYPGKPVAFAAVQRLVQEATRGTDVQTARTAAEDYVRVAAGFGRELELHAALRSARALQNMKDGTDVALDFARRAAKLLTEDDPPRRQMTVLKALVALLRDAGDGTALRDVKDRLALLDDLLDAEFEKRPLPFKLEPFAGRKDGSSRVAVVELFTGVHCPPCIAADIAFDALLKSYRPSEVILLQYHLHAPRPDPLTNADGEARAEMYNATGTPTLLINGKRIRQISGDVDDAGMVYKKMRGLLNQQIEEEAKAGLTLDVKRITDTIEVTTKITSLPSKSDARLRVLLIEDAVRYASSNGQRLHHHVVRAVVGDVEASAPNAETAPRKFTVSVTDLRKNLVHYLDKANREVPFLDDERPLNLERLKVVALLQDKASKEILHAVQADVPDGK